MIRPLYKAHKPFMEVPTGHGFLGVVMYDEDEDKVQCHACGEWRHSVGRHVLQHKMTAEDYKIKYGLTLRTALCGKSVSKRNSEINTTPQARIRFEKNRNRWTSNYRPKRRKSLPPPRGSMRAKNAVGLCELQIKARYAVVKTQAGKEPSIDDIFKYDRRLIAGIRTTYGTLNKLKAHLGISGDKWIEKIPDIECVAALRKFKNAYHRAPRVPDFQKKGSQPNYCTILKKFGSWSNALRVAGIK